MVSSKMVISAAVLAATTVSALGNAIVQNECAFPVYLWSVSNTPGSMVTVAAGGEYSESYKVNANGGGISIKLATDKTASNVTQFEYTLESSNLWYDLSNINGYPFVEYGLTLVPTVSTCRSIVCPAGTALCADAYNTPDENYATAECVSSADTVLILCSGDKSTTPGASVSVAASSAASTVPTATKTSTVSVTSAPKSSGISTTEVFTSTNVHTTFLTTVVTVVATAAPVTTGSATSTSSASEPWWSEYKFGGSKERRSGHIHRHAHAHGHQA